MSDFAPRYIVVPVDLTNARTRVKVVGEGPPIKNIALASLSAAGALSVHLGPDKDAIPLSAVADGLEIDPPNDTGIFVTNAAQAGVLASLLVSYANGPVLQPGN